MQRKKAANSFPYNHLPFAASKEKLTKRSQFIRIETIKIIRAVPVPPLGYSESAVEVGKGVLDHGEAVSVS
jgi:hypothetical protein